MSNNQFNLSYQAELNEGIRVTTLSTIFCSGDNQAHSFIVQAMRNSQPVSLSGATVRGFFIRPDNVTITLEGSVNADGCAVVTLDSSCYNKQGRFQITVCATIDGVTSTLFCGVGGMLLTITDGFIDEDGVVPSLNDLLAQIDAMEAATAAALEAADRANEAAENAGSGTAYPVVGTVDSDNNIILTSTLADGTYTLVYENTDGTQTEIGTVEVGSAEDSGDDNTEDDGGDEVVTYTNQIPISTDTDGSVYNSTGYLTSARCNSSGEVVEVTSGTNPTFVTGFIPCKQGDIIRWENCFMIGGSAGNDSSIYGNELWGIRCGLYDSSKTKIAVFSWGNFDDAYTDVVSDYTVGDGYKVHQATIAYSGTAYIRLCLAADVDNGYTAADAIVTVNEEIA